MSITRFVLEALSHSEDGKIHVQKEDKMSKRFVFVVVAMFLGGCITIQAPQVQAPHQFEAADLPHLVLQQSEVPADTFLNQNHPFGNVGEEGSARGILLEGEARLSDLGVTAGYWRSWDFGERYSGNSIGSGVLVFKNDNDATNTLRLITSLQEKNTSGRFKLNYSRVEGLGDEAYVAVSEQGIYYWWRTRNIILSFSYFQIVGTEYFLKVGKANWVSESKARELANIMQSHAQ